MRKQYAIVLNGKRRLNCFRPRERTTPMSIEFIVIVGLLAAAAAVGAVIVTLRDGYRRIPTRRA